MKKSCSSCGKTFEITDEDLRLLKKISPKIGDKTFHISEPKLCPACRRQRRLVWRNERRLYHRKCSKTGKQIISIYSPDKELPVFGSEIWWSDGWDPLEHGRAYDYDRSFFDQFKALQKKVPRIGLSAKNNENSDYTNHAHHLKNCYLLFTAVSCEDCYYGDWIIESRNCMDCSHITRCERCYELAYCTDCVNCAHLSECDQCSDSWFLYDCRSCRNCLYCWNLRQKEYHIQNRPVSKKEFEEALVSLRSHKTLEHAKAAFSEMRRTEALHPSQRAVSCQDSTGDHLIECKDVRSCFDLHRGRDVAYTCDAIGLTDSLDCNFTAFDCEQNYEVHACDGSKRTCFTTSSYDNDRLLYCDLCHNSSDLFGCIGLKRKKYCILNKQYSKEEYEELVPKIISQMQRDLSFGEFFPVTISPFAYNETISADEFPLTKKECVSRGWSWHQEKEEGQSYLGPTVDLPDSAAEITESIVQQILKCEASGQPYKIIPQELKFYRGMQIPLPRKCPDQRHMERMSLRNPRKLWDRACDDCHKPISTSYSPDRPEKVVCESCYLNTIY
ncbi:hypothetical protein A3A67_04040 [Candidatus Peribacteria bacterium RIFCSPLOWO2_01_FULL_51_18]|nr:MAG: hypothetical protein A3A67_04040 [Candidatus Peribacteria bacterium RIFCSPLOWO2_01_FULL_51_18]OGJ67809.1 MAG: hypothetical protein A3J34_01515 [Candidatus Peribacteria bacterium RIFCSPLOWO2_02_FULL_51_10]